MNRLLCAVFAAAACAGCRNPAPVYDPFLGRTTIEPPGTAVPAAGQPYYAPANGAPLTPPVVSPGAPATMPPNYTPPLGYLPPSAGNAPTSSFTPNTSAPRTVPSPPAGRQPLQLTPVSTSPRPNYGPPGGTTTYPQAAIPPQYGVPTLAQAPTPAAGPPANVGVPAVAPTGTPTPAVVPAANWQAAGSDRQPAATPAPFNPPPAGTPIRITQPAATAQPNTAAPPGLFRPSPSATPMPGSVVSSGTLNQTLASRAPDISELPTAQQAAATVTPAAARTSTTQGAFGYDHQYQWLKGKLEYSQSTRRWRLRYIPPDGATDQYGGSVVLADANKLVGFTAGDFVYAQGALGQSAGDENSFAPLYNVDRIQKQ